MPKNKSTDAIFTDIENAPTGSHKKLRRFKKVKASKKKAKKKVTKKKVVTDKEILKQFTDEKDAKDRVESISAKGDLLRFEQRKAKALAKDKPLSQEDAHDIGDILLRKKKSKKKFKLAPGIKKQIKKTVKRKAK